MGFFAVGLLPEWTQKQSLRRLRWAPWAFRRHADPVIPRQFPASLLPENANTHERVTVLGEQMITKENRADAGSRIPRPRCSP